MFGGWTARWRSPRSRMTRMKARTSDPDRELRGADPGGGEVRITARRLGGGRAVSHWCADLHGSDDVGPLATATVVLTGRRPTDGHVQVAMPEAPAPETLAEWHPPMAVGSLIDVRPVRGFPPFGRVDTTSLDWVRETSGRPVDRVQLALLADACAPRPFFWSEGPRPSATLR